MKDRIPHFLISPPSSDSFPLEGRSLRIPFLEKGMDRLAEMIKTAYAQWEFSSREGFFQKVDARIKILFLIFFLIIVSLKKDILSEILIGLFVFPLMLLSRLKPLQLYKKVLFLGFVFGFLISLPSALNLFREGEVLFPLLSFSKPYQIWIYSIPQTIGVTREGLYGVAMLTLRVCNSLSLTFLLFYTTPFQEIVRGLKVLKIPDAFLVVLILTYKYLFLFGKTAEEMHFAKKSRRIRELKPREGRRWVAGRIAFLFRKTRLRAEEVYRAMQCRGFSDTIKIHHLPKLKLWDWAVGISLFLVGFFLWWI